MIAKKNNRATGILELLMLLELLVLLGLLCFGGGEFVGVVHLSFRAQPVYEREDCHAALEYKPLRYIDLSFRTKQVSAQGRHERLSDKAREKHAAW